MHREIEETADGSHTLYIPQLDEHYHSVNGAVQESMHVYINRGFKQISKSKLSVLEVGFGTGLNAYLTLLESYKENIVVDYTGIELYPLENELLRQINYPQSLNANVDWFDKLHTTDWDVKSVITEMFSLRKIKTDFTQLVALSNSDSFDLIYYDAFAPDKQVEIWNQNIFDYLYQHTTEGGVLVTYCAKGSVRRMMQHAGYRVERLDGPPGKREMLRSTKIL